MADRARIVTFSIGGRPITTLDLNDGSVFSFQRDAFKISPPERKQVVASSNRRYGGAQVAGETHDNGTIDMAWNVKGSSKDDSIVQANSLLTRLEDQAPGRYLEWRPDGATRSVYYEIRGPSKWEPAYRWIVFQGTSVLQIAASLNVAPLAFGDHLDISDPFDVDSIGDYTFDAGAGTLTVSGGQLVPSSTAEKRLYHSARGYTYADVQVTLKFTTGASVTSAGNLGPILTRLDASNLLYLSADINGASSSLYIRKYDAAVFFDLATSGTFTLATATSYWLRARKEGNVLTVELFTAQPGPMSTPTQTLSHTLTGANATKFGTGIAGQTGLRSNGVPTDYRYDDYTVEPFTYRNQTLPKQISLGGAIPGTAPAQADITVTPSGGAAAPIWALLGWSKTPATPVAGAVAPFGVIEGESGTLTTWASAADANYRGGNGAKATTLGSGTASGEFLIDPAALVADDFTQGEIDVEVWSRFELASTVVSPVVIASVRPEAGTNFGAERLTQEFQGAGKLLTLPSSGTRFRFVKLGTITMYVDPLRPLRTKLRIAASWASGSTGQFGLDYLVLNPSRQRALSPTGKPNDGTYPKFVGSTSETEKRIRSDGYALTGVPPANGSQDQGLGGQQIELPVGNVDLVAKLSSLVPDDPTVDTTSEQLAHSATVRVSVRPRYWLGRGS